MVPRKFLDTNLLEIPDKYPQSIDMGEECQAVPTSEEDAFDRKDESAMTAFCGCQLYNWALSIGGIQIVFHLIAFIICAVGLSTGFNQKLDSPLPLIIGGLGVGFSILGIVSGILLIQGARKKSTSFLIVWIVLGVLNWMWAMTQAWMNIFHLTYVIIHLVVVIVIFGFGLKVVIMLRRGIQNGVYTTS